MAYTTINKSGDYFNTKLYSGNGTAIGSGGQAITGVGFQPDFTWIKERSSTSPHKLLDAVRGVTKELESNLTNAESTQAESLASFDSDGFTVGSNGAVNENSQTYASWNWKANGAGSANTDGTINSTVSANTTSGFSIVKWTAPSSGANTDTIGHGLSAVPKMIIVKTTSSTDAWRVYHNVPGIDKHGSLNSTNGFNSNTNIFPTLPTTSVFYPGSDASVNSSSRTYVAYCFAEKTGYSKFGSYTGTGDATESPFIYTGFKPKFILAKNVDDATDDWVIFDNKRAGYNEANYRLFTNLSNAETTSTALDLVSNGFKIRASSAYLNGSGENIIYMAFGQSLVGSNNIPCTAR